MQFEHSLCGRRRHVRAFLGQDRDSQSASRAVSAGVDIRIATARIEHHEPDQPGSDHEPDDEQPPVELGIHRREYRERERFEPGFGPRIHFAGCWSSPRTRSGPARPADHRLVRPGLRPRPGGDVHGHGPTRPASGERAEILANAMIIVPIAALIGGRLYHVIDQWALYKDDPIKIVLPPYSGLGVYGGIAVGDRGGVPRTRGTRTRRSCAGRTSSRRACSPCRRSPAGATSSTRSCTARRRPCRGASRSSASFAWPTWRARPTRSRRPASTRSSCTSRSPACSGPWH